MARRRGSRELALLVLLASCLASGSAFAAATLVLDDTLGKVSLSPYVEVLEDPSGKLTIGDVSSKEGAEGFRASARASLDYGYSASAFWTRFDLRNRSATQLKWLIKVDYSWFDEVELFVPKGDGSFTRKRATYNAPAPAREVKNPHMVFSFVLDSGREGWFYMRYLGDDVMALGTTLYGYDAFLTEDHDSQLFYGLIYGTMLIMVFYNLFLFFVLRDRSFLYYSGFVLFYCLSIFQGNMHFYEYLPPWLDFLRSNSYYLIFGLIEIFAFLFARSFLSTRKNAPFFHKLFLAFIGLSAFMAVGNRFLPTFVEEPLRNFILFSGCLAGLVAGIVCAARGIRAARFYLIGWSLILISNVVSAVLNLAAPDIPQGHLYDINGILLALLLSIGLADRYRLIRIEKERAERVNLEQTEFFINLSHEIKTPLTLVLNYLDEYMERREMTPELGVIKRSIDKLLFDMVNFFDVLRFQKGFHFYRHDKIVDLSSFLRAKVELFKSTAAANSLELTGELDEGLLVEMDPSALDRIVNNLVENAVKYNKPGGRIGISLRAGGGRIALTVSDTGIGIGADQLDKLFLPYYQISHKKGNVQGIGMGLSIVKGIVDELGGRIEARSEPGAGSSFIVTLARRELKRGEAVSDDASFFSPPPPRPLPKKPIGLAVKEHAAHSVLVVEDNDDLLRLLFERISEGYNVYAAADGAEALRTLETMPRPDVIVSDLMMDVMDGYALFDAVNESEKYANIPFIFITAKSSPDERLKGLRKGAVDLIYKPFVIDELVSKIDSIIRYQELKKENFEKEKFAAIGMLIGGISHEIYNPLSGIIAPLENIRKSLRGTELENSEKIGKYFGYIEVNIRRIEGIIANLRALYANAELEKETIGIEDIVDEVFGSLKAPAGKDLRLVKELADGALVFGNKEALSQILTNLVSNGIDAIEEKGTVAVRARREKGGVRIVVRDDGAGIARDDLDRLFDAFYSTKGTGARLGLGLYIVKDLVLKMGWSIRVDSEPGEGTSFSILAPDAKAGERRA